MEKYIDLLGLSRFLENLKANIIAFKLKKNIGAAEMNGCSATGSSSVAEGYLTIAGGNYSHAEGAGTTATGESSHAEGGNTTASGSFSHAEGAGTTASGDYSHAEGSGTTASGRYSRAEGYLTKAEGAASHAEGATYNNIDTSASADAAHAEGAGVVVKGQAAHGEGAGVVVKGQAAHGEGLLNVAGRTQEEAVAALADFPNLGGTTEQKVYKLIGVASHSEGSSTRSLGTSSHAEGNSTQALVNSTHAEGQNTIASGEAAHSEGYITIASGNQAHAEGYRTEATANQSHAEGQRTKATSGNAHAEGYYTTASGSCSHAEGNNTTASGESSHAEGNNTTASGAYSHAEGSGTTASVMASHAEGCYTTTLNRSEHAEGQYNVSHSATITYGSSGNTQHSVGIGTSSPDTKNAFEIMQNGDTYLYGVGGYTGTTIGGSVQTLQKCIGKMEEITWANLKALRDSSGLTPGMQYRITDYQTRTVQEGTQSAGNQFDVIVTATGVNKLSEEAKAIQHSSATTDYFYANKLEAWKIWYCLDNDTTRFRWADSGSTGRGVIYRMIDEFNNDCSYDFKNIQFTRKLTDGVYDETSGVNTYVYTFNAYDLDNGTIEDASKIAWRDNIDEGTEYCFSNVIKPSYTLYGGNNNLFTLNNIVFLNLFKISTNDYFECYCNNLGVNNYHITFGDFCYSNKFGDNCGNNTFGENCHSNKFGNGCYSNTFGDDCYSNTFGNGCSSIIFGNSCIKNTFGNNIDEIRFGSYSGGTCVPQNYYRNIIVEDNNYRIYLSAAIATDDNNWAQNITLRSGTNRGVAYKQLTIRSVNDNFTTIYHDANDVDESV